MQKGKKLQTVTISAASLFNIEQKKVQVEGSEWIRGGWFRAGMHTYHTDMGSGRSLMCLLAFLALTSRVSLADSSPL